MWGQPSLGWSLTQKFLSKDSESPSSAPWKGKERFKECQKRIKLPTSPHHHHKGREKDDGWVGQAAIPEINLRLIRWVLTAFQGMTPAHLLFSCSTLTRREVGSQTGQGTSCQLHLKMAIPVTLNKINRMHIPQIGHGHAGGL